MFAGDVEEGVGGIAEGFQEPNRDRGVRRRQRCGRGVRFGEVCGPRPVPRLRSAREWALKVGRRRLRMVGAEGRLEGEGGHDGNNVRTMNG